MVSDSAEIELTINEFDMDRLLPNSKSLENPTDSAGSKIIILGKPGSGKTTLIDDILYQRRNIFPVGSFQCGTDSSYEHFCKRAPEIFVRRVYSQQAVEKFMRRQQYARKQLQNPFGILLLDDLSAKKSIFNNELYRIIMQNGRHYQLLFILSMQYITSVLPEIRTMADYIIIMRETLPKNLKAIHSNFISCMTYEEFTQVMLDICKDHTCLIIDNKNQGSNKLEDIIFYYKANIVPDDFRIGCWDFWAYDKIRRDENVEISDIF